MKRKLFLMLPLVILLLCLPEKTISQMKFGVKAGLNFANTSMKDYESSYDTKGITAFHFGFLLNIPINDGLSIEPGLLYSQKGAKRSEYLEDYKLTMNYLDVLVNLKYEFEVTDNINLFAMGGAYVGYGLNGKTYIESEGVNLNWEEDEIKRIDLGVNIGAGVKYGQVQLSLEYKIGLQNISSDEELTVNHNVLGLSLAFFF